MVSWLVRIFIIAEVMCPVKGQRLGLGLGILFNVGRPLARRLLFQAPTIHTQYKYNINTYTVNQSMNQLVNQLVDQFVICSVGQCLLSRGCCH